MNASQALIVILLVANLLATVWFGLQQAPANVESGAHKAAAELPVAISVEVRDRLYEEFVQAFNRADYDALYGMLGRGARAQFSREMADAEFSKLVKYFHSVENGGFTHSKLAGTQGDADYYVLHYAVTLPDSSEFGPNGELTITVAVRGETFEVYGIRLNAGGT